MKILHCGDFHFDSPYIGFPADKGKMRAEEQLASFGKIIETVKKENADILLISGDIFENEYVTPKTTEFLKRCFADIPDTYVFIAPGNHDFISGNDVYKSIDLGENVVVFQPQIDFVEIGDLNARIYGYGFNTRFDEINLSANMPQLDKSFINIFLVHASLPPYSDTNPISSKEIEESGFDYVAAGHIHAHEGFQKYGETYAAYPGIPEGRYFDECGRKGFIILDISKDSFNGKFIEISKRTVSKVEVDISDCILISDIVKKLEHLDKKDIYEIILTGSPKENVYFDINTLKELLLENLFFVKVSSEIKPIAPKPQGLIETMFLEAIKKAGKDTSIAERAAQIGLMAIRGEEIR